MRLNELCVLYSFSLSSLISCNGSSRFKSFDWRRVFGFDIF